MYLYDISSRLTSPPPSTKRGSEFDCDNGFVGIEIISKAIYLKYGSEEKGSSLCRCSILLGFFMSKKLERLRAELLSEDKITNLLGFLTK